MKRPPRAGNLPRAGIVDVKPTFHSQSIRGNIDHMKITGGMGIAMKMHRGTTILAKGAKELMLYSQVGYPIQVGRRIR